MRKRITYQILLGTLVGLFVPNISRCLDLKFNLNVLSRESLAEEGLGKPLPDEHVNNEITIGKNCILRGEPRGIDKKHSSLFFKNNLGREQYLTPFSWPNDVKRKLPPGARFEVEVSVVVLRDPADGGMYASGYKVLRWREVDMTSGRSGEWKFPKIDPPIGRLPNY